MSVLHVLFFFVFRSVRAARTVDYFCSIHSAGYVGPVRSVGFIGSVRSVRSACSVPSGSGLKCIYICDLNMAQAGGQMKTINAFLSRSLFANVERILLFICVSHRASVAHGTSYIFWKLWPKTFRFYWGSQQIWSVFLKLPNSAKKLVGGVFSVWFEHFPATPKT